MRNEALICLLWRLLPSPAISGRAARQLMASCKLSLPSALQSQGMPCALMIGVPMRMHVESLQDEQIGKGLLRGIQMTQCCAKHIQWLLHVNIVGSPILQ